MLQKLKEARPLEIFVYAIAAFIVGVLVRVLANLVSILLSLLSLVLLFWAIFKWSKERKYGKGMENEEIKSEKPKVETDPTSMGDKSNK